MIRIGIDVMGGDHAPEVTTLGCILAFNELPGDSQLVLFGDKQKISEIALNHGFDPAQFNIVDTPEVIEMGDNPSKAFTQKPNSSISVGFKYLYADKIDGFASAGNTGAMMVGTMYTIKSVDGIIRPVITASIPMPNGKYKVFMDVGLNADCKPEVLVQFALLGSIYVETFYGIKNPKIALLNIGSEDEKGNLLTKATFQLLKSSKEFNFIGNIEGNDFFNDKADVVICDGFTGNIVLKQAEAFYSILKERNIHDPYLDQLNSEDFGGTPVLGVNKPVIIGHGHSSEIAIKNMILMTRDVICKELTDKIKQAFKE